MVAQRKLYEIDKNVFDLKLAQLLKKADDLRVPFRTIAKNFRQSRKGIFRNRTGPGLYPDFKSDIYKARKEKLYGSAYPILKASGRLEESLTEEINENISEIKKKSLRMGTSVPYAEFHDEGTAKMAQRKVVFFGPEAPRFSRQAPGEIRGFANNSYKVLKDYLVRT